jgi:predicted MFS family arabinose efflux permease
MAGYALNGAAFVGLAQAASPTAVYAACAVLALGNSLATPSLNALISRGTSVDEQGAVLGSAQSLASLARAVAPPTGGLLFEGLFPQAPMLGGAVVILGALALSLPALNRARPAASGSSPSSAR